jgi:hypothetical protein
MAYFNVRLGKRELLLQFKFLMVLLLAGLLAILIGIFFGLFNDDIMFFFYSALWCDVLFHCFSNYIFSY